MNRLSKEQQDLVTQLITYSSEDFAILSGIKNIRLLWGVTKAVDPADFTTPEGMSKQLDRFVLPDGLLYYVQLIDKVPQMQRVAVSIPASCIDLVPKVNS